MHPRMEALSQSWQALCCVEGACSWGRAWLRPHWESEARLGCESRPPASSLASLAAQGQHVRSVRCGPIRQPSPGVSVACVEDEEEGPAQDCV